ncbi:MAG TPA: uracil-DNA glycosylase [Pyrinomonadaceae bacterium]|nr:uracil-DNA glycosylase [Pyrinomonadaceae bacterium]
MLSDSIENELASLADAAHEHVLYMQELGADGFEGEVVTRSVPIEVKQRPAAPQPVPRKAVPPAPSQRSNATPSPSTSANSLFEDIFKGPETKLPESNETFAEIWADVGDCSRCDLCKGRTNIVHTEGNQKARLMFVGEAPGADEDSQARPFIGRAGQLLNKIIEAIGMKREEVLIGNINRCRPPGNRAPLPDEVVMCKPFLLREIASARPEVIVVLGNTAMKNLLDTREGITRLRGIFQDYKGIKVMPTFHPAYLLRDPSKKRETWEDLKKVRDYLDSTRAKP